MAIFTKWQRKDRRPHSVIMGHSSKSAFQSVGSVDFSAGRAVSKLAVNKKKKTLDDVNFIATLCGVQFRRSHPDLHC